METERIGKIGECARIVTLTEVYRKHEDAIPKVAEIAGEASNFCSMLQSKGNLEEYNRAYKEIDVLIDIFYPYKRDKDLLEEVIRIVTENKSLGRDEIDELQKYAQYKLEAYLKDR